MQQRSAEDQLDLELMDALGGLLTRLLSEAERLAKDFEVPAFFLKALHFLDGPLAMKELGKRMHCDPSFVTSIADMLEKRGLAARESDPADRRVKRLVLTGPGAEMKCRVEHELLARMPWRQRLTPEERATLAALIRKMITPTEADAAACPVEEVTSFLAKATTPPVS